MLYPSFSLEYELLTRFSFVAGVDEVGRGCLAGPVVACIAVFSNPIPELHKLVRDSKTLSEKQREYLASYLQDNVHDFAIGSGTPREVDVLGIRKATYRAMLRAYWKLKQNPDIVLMDGESATIPIFSKTYQYNHGDSLHYSIAAASILAKVYRDKLMKEIENEYPQYGFAQHKGYGTKQHYESLLKYGITPIHRKSFLNTAIY